MRDSDTTRRNAARDLIITACLITAACLCGGSIVSCLWAVIG